MNEAATIFALLGGTFLVGLAADAIGRRTPLPRVTMVMVVGFLVGPGCLGLLPEGYEVLFQRAAEIALTMVGFLLGERLVHSIRGGQGRAVLIISVVAVAVTAAVVSAGLWLAGVPVATALILAGLATATAPAATVDMVRQVGARGKFADTLLGVVALDDAWGLMGFGLLMAAVQILAGDGQGFLAPLGEGLWEIGGAVLLGGLLGLAMAAVTGRIAKGEPTLLEALGFVFLCAGLSLGFGTSFILTAMVMGATVALAAKHHEYPFHTIEDIEIPFMILFFALAGSSLDLGALGAIGWMGGGYVLLRVLGRILGGWGGALLCGAPVEIRRWMGLALMPQAGVALGMALLAQQKMPEAGAMVLQIAIGSTVFFELVGPLMTRWALVRGGGLEPGDPG